MKKQGLCVAALALAAAGLGLQSPRQEEGQAELEARVLVLEQRVTQLEQYLQRQAQGADRMKAALDQSEKEGFTYGINPRSREILLAALREAAASVQSNVPGQEAGKPPAPDKKGGNGGKAGEGSAER